MEEQNKNEMNEVEVVNEETTKTEVKEEYTGKQATTYICYDYKTLKSMTMYNTVVKRHGPIKYLVLGIVALCAAIFVIVNAIIKKANSTEDMNITSNILMGGIFALFSIYIIIQAFQFESQVDKAIIKHLAGKKEFNEHNVIVREDKVTIIPLSHVADKYDYEWYQITNIDEIPGYFILFAGQMPIIIERDPNKMVEGSYEDMLEIIQEKIQTKPFKKYEKVLYKKPTPTQYEHEEVVKNYKDIEKELLKQLKEKQETVSNEEVSEEKNIEETATEPTQEEHNENN